MANNSAIQPIAKPSIAYETLDNPPAALLPVAWRPSAQATRPPSLYGQNKGVARAENKIFSPGDTIPRGRFAAKIIVVIPGYFALFGFATRSRIGRLPASKETHHDHHQEKQPDALRLSRS